MSKGNRYDDEFKQMIVNLYKSGKLVLYLNLFYIIRKNRLNEKFPHY